MQREKLGQADNVEKHYVKSVSSIFLIHVLKVIIA